MSNEKQGTGFFEGGLAILGAIAGASFGYEHGEFVGLIIGALMLGAIGKVIGAATDWIVKLIAIIVYLMMIGVVRRAFIDMLFG